METPMAEKEGSQAHQTHQMGFLPKRYIRLQGKLWKREKPTCDD